MGKSKGLTTVTAGLTGLRATGQLKDAGGGSKATGYVNQVAKADAALGKAMGTLHDEHMADYMAHTAPKHGLVPLPPRVAEPPRQSMTQPPGMPRMPGLKGTMKGMR